MGIGRSLSRTRTRGQVRRDLGRLDAALRLRLSQMRAEDYWQRQVCGHADGCREEDCDGCAEFMRKQ